jgi:hypothetical protein
LLEKEGVVFRKGRVDLREFGWLQSINDDLKKQQMQGRSRKVSLRALRSR